MDAVQQGPDSSTWYSATLGWWHWVVSVLSWLSFAHPLRQAAYANVLRRTPGDFVKAQLWRSKYAAVGTGLLFFVLFAVSHRHTYPIINCSLFKSSDNATTSSDGTPPTSNSTSNSNSNSNSTISSNISISSNSSNSNSSSLVINATMPANNASNDSISANSSSSSSSSNSSNSSSPTQAGNDAAAKAPSEGLLATSMRAAAGTLAGQGLQNVADIIMNATGALDHLEAIDSAAAPVLDTFTSASFNNLHRWLLSVFFVWVNLAVWWVLCDSVVLRDQAHAGGTSRLPLEFSEVEVQHISQVWCICQTLFMQSAFLCFLQFALWAVGWTQPWQGFDLALAWLQVAEFILLFMLQWQALRVYSKADDVQSRSFERLRRDPQAFFKEDVLRAKCCCLALIAVVIFGVAPWCVYGRSKCEPKLPANVTGCVLSGNSTTNDIFTCTILGSQQTSLRICGCAALLIMTSGSWLFYARSALELKIVPEHIASLATADDALHWVRTFTRWWSLYTGLGYLSMAVYGLYCLVMLLLQASSVDASRTQTWDKVFGFLAACCSAGIVCTGWVASDLLSPPDRQHTKAA